MKKMLSIISAVMIGAAPLWAAQTVAVALDVTDLGSNKMAVRYLCWLLPPSNPIPQPNFVSAWVAKTGVSTGPSAAQVTALQNGTVIEKQFSLPVSTGTLVTTIEQDIEADCKGQQQYLNGQPGPAIFYGFHNDGVPGVWAQQ